MLDEPRTLVRGKPGARVLIKHAWHTAAEVTGFVITADPATRRLTLGGMVATSDPYRLTQAPLVCVLPLKSGAMRWPIETLTVSAGRVVAQLGALVERE